MNKPFENFSTKAYPEGSMTQGFAENPDLYRPWGLQGHNGVDYVAPHGTPLFAVEDATVIDVNYNPDGYGKYVRLMSRKTSAGKYREWTYGHLSAIHVTKGKKVKAGDTIGLMGNTGFVVSGNTPWWDYNPYAGTHLHLGMRVLEMDDNGWRYGAFMPKVRVMNYDNGYKGGVDFTYFFGEDDKRQKMLTVISLLNTVVSLLKKKVALQS